MPRGAGQRGASGRVEHTRRRCLGQSVDVSDHRACVSYTEYIGMVGLQLSLVLMFECGQEPREVTYVGETSDGFYERHSAPIVLHSM